MFILGSDSLKTLKSFFYSIVKKKKEKERKKMNERKCLCPNSAKIHFYD